MMHFSPYQDFGGPSFDLFSVVFMIVFLLILGFIIVGIVQSIQQRQKNNASPVLEVEARLVTKRSDVSRYRSHTNNNHVHNASHTSYFATFEVQSGDRLEFTVTGEEYGQLAEHDAGKLTFQGTRYLAFNRNMN